MFIIIYITHKLVNYYKHKLNPTIYVNIEKTCFLHYEVHMFFFLVFYLSLLYFYNDSILSFNNYSASSRNFAIPSLLLSSVTASAACFTVSIAFPIATATPQSNIERSFSPSPKITVSSFVI